MKKTIIALLIVLMLAVAGCTGASKTDIKNAQILSKMLQNEKVPFTAVSAQKDTITVTYEASAADQYDTQIIGDWGSIFGAASLFKYENIVIVNTVNDVPYVRFTSSKQNVDDFSDGLINDTVFWENVEIDAYE